MIILQIQAGKLPSTTVTAGLDLPPVYLIEVTGDALLFKDYDAPGHRAHHSVWAALHHRGRQ